MSGSMLLSEMPLPTCRLSNKLSFISDLQRSESVSCPQTHLRRGVTDNIHLKEVLFFGQSICCYKLKPASSLSSEDAYPIRKEPVLRRGKNFEQWDSMTAKLAGVANLPFLLIKLPQIILNARNLMAGNKSALLAVPWLGMLTGLLGNLYLVSYFISKMETEGALVQTLVSISMYIVMLQLAMGEAMPLPHFIATSILVTTGLILNYMKYFHLLNKEIWNSWEDFITVAGLATLPQVMWSTFVPYVPNTILPGVTAFATAVFAVLMARIGKLPDLGVKFLGLATGWMATLLFMWMGVVQMWTNILYPENIQGLSASSMFLHMAGNAFLIPRALFIRDFMWFTSASWGAVFFGWGNLICLYCFNCITKEFFWASTLGFLAWIGLMIWKDKEAHGLSSPVTSLKELVFGA